MILLIYTAYFISGTMCYEEKQTDYGTNLNVTILYPVKNNLISLNKNNSGNFESKSGREEKLLSSDSEKCNGKPKMDNSTKVEEEQDENRTHSNNNENEKPKVPKIDTANWKIDTSFTPSKLQQPESVNGKNKNDSNSRTIQASEKEFKPSPQLGHFYNEDAFVVPTEETIGSFTPVNNPSSFFSSPGDFYKLNYKPPITYPDPIDTPYKFENTVPRDKEWKFNSENEPKPTVEAPVKIPAGGLYKLPDPFKEKPSSDGDDDNFGLDFNDEEKDAKANPAKKRGNPWKGLLHLVTALLPVGIILSALTPNILTLESTDNNQLYPTRYSRRSGDVTALLPISEDCKRRLLCEIHSDSNYMQSSHRQKQCYKIQCNDPQALGKVLHWLLQYSRSRHRPAAPPGRGYHLDYS